MKRLILLLLIFISFNSTNAQDIKWAQSIYSHLNGGYNCSALDRNGNLYIANSFPADTADFNNNIHLKCSDTGDYSYIAKYNSDGICQWATTILISSNYVSQSRSILDIAVDSNSNIIVLGTFWGNKVTFNNGIEIIGDTIIYDVDERNQYLAKYNSNGVCIWADKISRAKINGNFETSRIQCDKQGNIYFKGSFGKTMVFNNNISLIYDNIEPKTFITKYNGDGLCQWAECILNNSGNDTYSNGALAVSADGEIYFTDRFWERDTLKFNNGIKIIPKSVSYYQYNSYFAKYNTDGLCKWAQEIYGRPEIYDITLDKDRKIIFGGNIDYQGIEFQNGVKNSEIDTSKLNHFIARCDSNGACLWVKTFYGNKNCKGDVFSSIGDIKTDNYGNIYLCGDISDTLVFNSKFNLINKFYYKNGFPWYNCSYIAKFNSNGIINWAANINNAIYSCVESIELDPLGNLYFISGFSSKELYYNDVLYLKRRK